MDVIIDYLKGLLVIIGFFGYPFVFNHLFKKWFGEDLWMSELGPVGAILFPYMITIAGYMALILPLLVGRVIFE